MRQDAQKPVRKFCAHKTAKNAKTHPEKPEKGKTGCVLGAGGGSSGWWQVKPGEKGHYRAGEREGGSSIAWWKWRDGLELASQALLRCPALSAAAGPPCQSPTAAPSPPRCIRHRRRFGGDARHAPRASVSPTAITKNSATANAVGAVFGRGQKDLNPRHAVLEWMWKQTTGSRERPVLPGSPEQVPKEWCWFGATGKFSGPKRAKKSGKSPEKREMH